MKKRCFKCGEVKVLDDFYKHPQMGDGHLNKCKLCTKRDVSKNYRDNVKHYVLYEKQRFQTSERKEYALEQQRTRRSKNPDKYKANSKVSVSIRDGKLIPQPCVICGDKAEAHPPDYSKPLEVM